MILSPIPNQPVNLVDSSLQGCLCDPLVPTTLIGQDDRITFAFNRYGCPGQESLVNQSFTEDWRFGDNAQLAEDGVCLFNGLNNTAIIATNFTAIPGYDYRLRIGFQFVTGSIVINCGGWATIVSAAGFYDFVFTAINTQTLIIATLGTTSSCCVFGGLQLERDTNDLTVTFRDQAGDEISSFNLLDDPEYFQFDGEQVIFGIDVLAADLTGCFRIEVTDCVESILESDQLFQVIRDTTCTLMLSACNDYASLGFPAAFRPQMRVAAKLVRPTWEYEVSEERRSNGRHLRHYIDRQVKYDLLIDLQSEHTLPFIATLPMFDHVYIGQTEYVVDTEQVEPEYDDIFDGTGQVRMTVRPKQQLLRNVMCGPELGGCVPKPTQLGTQVGIDGDVLLQTGGLIELNNG
jgi:hypothetical protein